jgi:ketosteroid isomerase-like protein
VNSTGEGSTDVSMLPAGFDGAVEAFRKDRRRPGKRSQAMRTAVVAAILCLPAIGVVADETDDRVAVVQRLDDFFEALSDSDVERMRAMMTPDGVLFGYRETPEGLQVIRRTHTEFLDSLANSETRMVERIWNPEVMLEGRLATVWTPYDVYRDGIFSHCGTNNFSMLKTDDGWIIAGVVYSMQVDDCGESPLGPFTDDRR